MGTDSKAELKVEGGKLVKVRLRLKDGRIDKIEITGDFFAFPEDLIEGIERGLIGLKPRQKRIIDTIRGTVRRDGGGILGVKPEHIARAILDASKRDHATNQPMRAPRTI
ncbi:MAG: lipoate protein ligase C-terminal domain-containing protein [Candidatus Bathyarchaeia archaeon]